VPHADITIRTIADFEILGIFDITVNGVLVHSRKCDSHHYGQPGHLWLRDDKDRQTAVWQAVQSALSSRHACHDGCVDIHVRHSTYSAKYSEYAAELISSWFPDSVLHINDETDNSSDWNFEISINGVVLHSRATQGHGFFYDEWNQQCLIWKAVKGVWAYDQLIGA
jgi:predicted Rdx family selenoprotein